MNERTPPRRGSSRRPWGSQKQGSEAARPTPSEDLGDLRWSTRSRCLAVLQELDGDPIDWDSIQTLLEGAAEDVAAAT